MIRLPVSGVEVVLRAPAGADDVVLLEAGPPSMAVAVALLGRLACDPGGARLDPAELPISDVDVLLLRLRQQLIGDAVSAEAVCPSEGCRARVDIAFSIAAFLAHHGPAAPPVAATDDGWYRLAGGAEFRVPRAADHLAIARAAAPEQALLQRCVRPDDVSGEVLQEVELALEAMAPSLYTELEGICPACGGAVEASFDPVHYTLRELRDRAAFLYDDVCAIAHHFHWSEAEILALPAARRTRYAELAQQAQQNRTA